MNGNTRNRLDAALDVIKAVYNYVDAGLTAEDPGIMKQAYEELVNSGRSSRQARRQVSREMFAGVSCTRNGYSFSAQTGLDHVATMSAFPMDLQA